ncbi:small-conductance mechanosensitive channel [Caldisphaera lagunensis DSM 15908]|uniref:Small-conductance mechanosensitive channel n=1 Tax=Caldisphaera lagunensis (strain DSM 15908 / JCM 11604 / ANMR 0165 / IC-154) TaxID=1056495 RepID=L0A901_CALLD|nr:mechanosensitive ion channel family protein [Caldisphaera lagunensis]AFZ70368.1 small-conductance mechanosensitive channel [Caldisphaera lagunensis DSM 15908]
MAEIISIVAIVVTIYLFVNFLAIFIHRLQEYMYVVRDVLYLAAGLLIVRSIGNGIIRSLFPKYRERSLSVGNLVKIVGYIIVIIAVIAFTKISTTVALFGGTVTGLVLGYALQPTLDNLFSGILILTTGFIKPGERVRVINWRLPYQWASNPGYKYFSPDYIIPGYDGKVVEVGLFASSIITDQGYELKITNSHILGGGIIKYQTIWEDNFTGSIRVEIPISDMEAFELHAKKVLSKFDDKASFYLTEQSDKNYLIYLVKISVPKDQNWLQLKDSILRELLSYKNSDKQKTQ